jgi:periplasmic protein CpxP/Spy
MMRVRNILPLLLVLCVGPVLGQMGNPPREKDRVKDLKEKLQLTEDQTKKVETIFNNNKKKMDASFEKKERGSSDPRKMMDSIMSATDKEIEKILTKEQKEKFAKMIQDRKKEMRDMPPPPPQGRMDDERGMMPPERQFGFQDRMDRPERFDEPGMRQPLTPNMERRNCDKNMCPNCCSMRGGRILPPPPPEPFEEDDDDQMIPDDLFEL